VLVEAVPNLTPVRVEMRATTEAAARNALAQSRPIGAAPVAAAPSRAPVPVPPAPAAAFLRPAPRPPLRRRHLWRSLHGPPRPRRRRLRRAPPRGRPLPPRRPSRSGFPPSLANRRRPRRRKTRKRSCASGPSRHRQDGHLRLASTAQTISTLVSEVRR
jgi:hypothetical protein